MINILNYKFKQETCIPPITSTMFQVRRKEMTTKRKKRRTGLSEILVCILPKGNIFFTFLAGGGIELII